MLTDFHGRVYVTLTNFEFEYDIGYERDWNAFKEAVDDCIMIMKENLEHEDKKGALPLI